MTKTPWFPGTVKPSRPGVYEREFPHRPLFAEWTGHQWLRAAQTPREATRRRDVSNLQTGEMGEPVVRWRGLAEPAT